MLIEANYHDEVRVAVVNEKSELENFEIESKNKSNTKGNIYLAKVLRVEPSLQAVFVDYGNERQGFLSFSNIHPDYYQIPIADRQALEKTKETNNDFASLEQAIEESQQMLKTLSNETQSNENFNEDLQNTNVNNTEDEDSHASQQEPIHKEYKVQDVIKPKQILLVQVEKEERGNKCAALTTYVSLAGRYCILMPNAGNRNAISKKITNQNTRLRIKKILDEINSEGNFNVVIRTAGEKKTKNDIKKDYDFLIKTWTDIKNKALQSNAPCLIYKESCLIKRSLRDLYSKDVKEVIVSGEESYKIAKEFMATLLPSHARRIKLYKGSLPLFTKYGIDQQVDSTYSSRVQLPSGGYIVINPTEALISIDVNSGKSTKERNIEETAISTNIEAAKEIAKQVMVRNMSGLIVIDFIDMTSNANNTIVEKTLKSLFKNDRAKVQISKVSKLGLIEISRQRLRPSMVETFFSCCPLCDGFGLVNDASFAALRIIRAINNYAIRNKSKGEIVVSLNFEILNYLFNHYKKQLLQIEEDFNTKIELRPDRTISFNSYKIEGRNNVNEQQKNRAKDIRQKQNNRHSNNHKPVVKDNSADERKSARNNESENTQNNNIKQEKFNKNKKVFSIAKPTDNLIEEVYDSSAQNINHTENSSEGTEKNSLKNKQKVKKQPKKNKQVKKIEIIDVSKVDNIQHDDNKTSEQKSENKVNTSENSTPQANTSSKRKKTNKKNSTSQKTKQDENTSESEVTNKNNKPSPQRKRRPNKRNQDNTQQQHSDTDVNNNVIVSEVSSQNPATVVQDNNSDNTQQSVSISTNDKPAEQEDKPKKRGWWNKLIRK